MLIHSVFWYVLCCLYCFACAKLPKLYYQFDAHIFSYDVYPFRYPILHGTVCMLIHTSVSVRLDFYGRLPSACLRSVYSQLYNLNFYRVLMAAFLLVCKQAFLWMRSLWYGLLILPHTFWNFFRSTFVIVLLWSSLISQGLFGLSSGGVLIDGIVVKCFVNLRLSLLLQYSLLPGPLLFVRSLLFDLDFSNFPLLLSLYLFQLSRTIL